LHFAAMQGHVRLAERLLASGADIGAKNKQGWTPLEAAIRKGRSEVAELLEAADPNA